MALVEALLEAKLVALQMSTRPADLINRPRPER